MTDIFPELHDIRIFQKPGHIASKSLETVDQLLLILPRRIPKALWRRLPQGSKLQALLRKSPPDATPALQTRLANKRQTLVVAGRIDGGSEAFEMLTFARKLVAAATTEKAGSLGILIQGFDAEAQKSLCDAVLAAALAAGFNLPAFKEKATPAKIRSIRVLGLDDTVDLLRNHPKRAKGVEIVVESEIPAVKMLVDDEQIRRVFTNLAVNAFDDD